MNILLLDSKNNSSYDKINALLEDCKIILFDRSNQIDILANKIDIIVTFLDEDNIEIVRKIKFHIPVLAIVSEKCSNKEIYYLKNSQNYGLTHALKLDDEIDLRNEIKTMVDNQNESFVSEDLTLIHKSKSMHETLKQIKSLKSSHVFSIVGLNGTGKKFLAKYVAKKWKKTLNIIDCKNTDSVQNFLNFGNLIIPNQEQIFVINYPSELSNQDQMKLVNILNNTIGQKSLQFIAIYDEIDEQNIIYQLAQKLSIFKVHMPSIKERKEDVPDIINIFEKELRYMMHKKVKKQDIEAIKANASFNNFIELKNQIAQLFYKSTDAYLQKNIEIVIDDVFLNMNLKQATKFFEKTYLQKQLMEKKMQMQKLAKLAGINRTTLYRKLKNL